MNPQSAMARLEALPGWWRGKASVRRDEADIAMAAGFEKHADEQLRIATEYEKKAMAETLTRNNGA
jgi:hypothetical protein